MTKAEYTIKLIGLTFAATLFLTVAVYYTRRGIFLPVAIFLPAFLFAAGATATLVKQYLDGPENK